MKKVFLLKSQQKRFLSGHLWIYSNALDPKRTSFKSFQAGELVEICAVDGTILGIGYINPHSLICVRVLTKEKTLPVDWLLQRIKNALAYRAQFYPEPYYRLVYGESDFLPGLVIDRYGDDFVMQINTAGMENLIDEISQALVQLCKPRSIWLKADSSMRPLENLPSYSKTLYGTAPDEFALIENGTCFTVPREASQKTGWFYDHRENRHFVQQLAQNKTVLDLFCYAGSFGISAAKAGATHVTCVDASQTAIDFVLKNAQKNNVANKVDALCEDAFSALAQLKKEQQSFDIIVLDPPAFIKRQKDHKQGLTAYHRLNQQAVKLLNPGGILVSASCSYHLSELELQDIIAQSFSHQNRQARIIRKGTPGFDHPIHPAMPETLYLKTFFVKEVNS